MLAIFCEMVYTNSERAGVMGSDRSAASGGCSDLSEWQRSTSNEGVRAKAIVGHRNRNVVP